MAFGGRIGDSAASPSKYVRRERIMFARFITLQLKPNLAKEFPVMFEKEILPLLKKQKGFMDELLLVTPEKKELVAISMWETKEYAEIYNRELYPRVEKMVEKFIEGVPVVRNYEELFATFHKMAVAVTI